MKVLVTGGAGNLGQEVTRLLRRNSHEPVIYDRFPVPDADIRCEVGDINDSERLSRIFKEVRPEGIIHLASMLQFACEADPAGAVATNVDGTVAVLDAAQDVGVERFVLASSVAVYGSTAFELNEDSAVQSDISIYGVTKFLAERLLRRYQALYGMTCRSLRFSTILSSRPVASQGVAAVVAKLFSAVSGQNVTVTQVAGSERRHYVHVKDAAQGVVLAVTKEACEDDLFNIAGPADAYLSFEELVRLIGRVCPSAGRVGFSGASGDRAKVDWRRAAVQLGYQPRYGIEQAVMEAVESCLNKS